MKHFGLIGERLGHSFSKTYFEQKFCAENIDADYTLCEVPSVDQLPQVLTKKWDGLNITIPYKTAILPLLDEISPEAQKIGAVNTIQFVKRGDLHRLIGHNTDAIGFEESLRPLLTMQCDCALVLGTGGASRAVTYVLDKLGIKWIYVSREAGPHRLDYAEVDSEVVAKHHLIINATPLGMWPEVDGYPDIPYRAITPQHLLFDLVYNPAETPFLAKGKAQGATIKNGLEMLHLQAEAAYKIWAE